jgi:hypothetical protein
MSARRCTCKFVFITLQQFYFMRWFVLAHPYISFCFVKTDISVTGAVTDVIFHFDDPEQSLTAFLAIKNTSISTRRSTDLINTLVTPRPSCSYFLASLLNRSHFLQQVIQYIVPLYQCSSTFFHPRHTLICHRHMMAHQIISPYEKLVRNYT